MSNRALVIVLVVVAITFAALQFVMVPTCKGGEVMVKGVYSFVCVTGHH
jgi:hypothetical protein